MTPTIIYIPLVGMYAVKNGGHTDIASTYHDADLIIQSIQEAEASAMMGGDPLLIDAGAFATACKEAWRIGPICPTCGDDGDCPDCGTYTDMRTPLLAQCAHVIRACLGNVPAGGGIIDELRVCDAALRRQGW